MDFSSSSDFSATSIHSVTENDDEDEQLDSESLVQPLRLRLHAANLPRQGRRRAAGVIKALPDTFAVVTSISGGPCQRSYASSSSSSLPPSTLRRDTSDSSVPPSLRRDTPDSSVPRPSSKNLQGVVWGRTEVIARSSSPQWTQCIDLKYKLGSQLFFNVHVFVHDNHNNKNKLDYSKSLGSALFEVGDILQTRNNTRVKRLRVGGCVFCRLERVNTRQSKMCLRLEWSASHLILPHSKRRRRTTPFQAAQPPNTLMEIARRPSEEEREDQRNQNGSTGAAINGSSHDISHLQRCGAWVTIYRSQVTHESFHPTFDPAEIDMHTLGDDWDGPLRVSVRSVKSNGAMELIGMAETTLRHLLRAGEHAGECSDEDESNDDQENELSNDNSDHDKSSHSFHPRPNELFLQRNVSKRKQVGRLRIHSAQLVSPDGSELRLPQVQDAEVVEVVDLAALQPVSPPAAKSFQDYINQGCEIDFCVAIDFTSSNGNPRVGGTLHYQSEDSLNDYEETIVALGKAIDAYNKSGNYAVWGFGAKYGGAVRHLFQCGSQPSVSGVDGILSAYRSVFQSSLIMSGPTVLTLVLQAAAVQARRHHERMDKNSLRYCVLLIVTDGLADKFEETKRKLAVYSEMPLSVVIVGVGRSDFKSMHRLCQPIGSARHNTSFVEFRQHQHDPSALGAAALQEVPAQLCEYMRLQGF